MIEVNNSGFNQSQVSRDEKGTRLEEFSYKLLLFLSFLLPIFFIPNIIFPFQFGKVLVLSLGTLSILSLWVVSRLRAGGVGLPNSFVFYFAELIILFGLISTLLSGSIGESFWGISGESSTYFFFLILFLLLFISYKILNSEKRVRRLYFVSLISFSILAVYQLLRVFFGADFLDFGILTSTTSSLVSRWNDLSILFGLSVLISMLALEFLSLSRKIKYLVYLVIALFLLLMVIINSFLSWIVLTILTLLLITYLYFQKLEGSLWQRISKLPLAILFLSVVLILLRVQIGNFVLNNFNISRIEARPSFVSTLSIAQNVLDKDPGFGSGLNRFSIEWGLNKPVGVNNTIFWNTDFNYGIGIIPTFLITNGIVGLLSWILFLGSLLIIGFKMLFLRINDNKEKFVALSSVFSVFYLWTFSIVSVPGITILGATFLMTGILLSIASKEGLIRSKNLSFSDESRTGFIAVFALVLVLILNIGLIYTVSSRYLSSVYAEKSIKAANEGNLDLSFKYISRAISLAENDNNYRLLSQIHIARLNDLLNQADVAGTEEGIKKFQEILGNAIKSAERAKEIDGADYRNSMTLGSIYEAIIPLGIEGAYESAKKTYEGALIINPTNPSIDLSLARLEVINDNNEAARVYIDNALRKKNNYTEAIYLLSQIEINEGNIAKAIEAVRAASFINPNDPLVFFQLGFLEYSLGRYEEAVASLERATALNSSYSNAKYFLGLSYYNLDKADEAIVQFEEIKELNPDNAEVKQILENLRAGNEPLLNIGGNGGVGDLPLDES